MINAGDILFIKMLLKSAPAGPPPVGALDIRERNLIEWF